MRSSGERVASPWRAHRARAADDRAVIAFWSMSSGVGGRARVSGVVRRVAVTRRVYHSGRGAAKTCYPSRAVRLSLSVASVVLIASVGMSLAGCGRRATQADCRLIVDRSVELQMKEMSETDPKVIAKREAEVRAELDDEIKKCEGQRHVTEKTMSCVQAATTTAELDKCLR